MPNAPTDGPGSDMLVDAHVSSWDAVPNEEPTDAGQFTLVQSTTYDGVRDYDGSVPYKSGGVATETMVD